MIKEPKIGLVTVLYNGIEVLEGFFQSLATQTYKNYTLYVIDNSPDDIALDEAKRLSKLYNIESVFINNNDNLGVAKGNNQGIEKALNDECEFVLLLNNDIEFSETTIKGMLHHAVQNHENIIVPKIYYYGTNKIWMAGGYISKLKGISPHRGDGEEDTRQYDNIEYINYAPTCFMLIHQEVFKNIGLMDEEYFVYYDDTDFVYRANEKGYKIVYYPAETVEHKVSFSTGGGESLFSIYYGNRNRVIFIKNNFSFFYKVISLSFFYLSRVFKFISYNKDKREALIKALRT